MKNIAPKRYIWYRRYGMCYRGVEFNGADEREINVYMLLAH